MTKYYSPSTGGFYDDAIHGSRKIAAPLTPYELGILETTGVALAKPHEGTNDKQ